MTNDMTKGSPLRHILFFSIPILIGNIFQQLYNMCDTIIVGRYVGTNSMGAVGSTSALSFLILGFVLGITSGFGVIIAQAFGAKDEEKLKESLATSTVLCIIITIILTVIAMTTCKTLLTWMNTKESMFQDAYTYIMIIYAGIACSMVYNMVSCILRALGDSKTPLYFLLFSSALNIVLDLLFIIKFDLGVAGAGYATILSQGISGLLCFIYMFKKFPMLLLGKRHFKLKLHTICQHLAIGLPMAFQFSITAIGVIILQSALNLFSESKISAFTAASKIEQLAMQPSITFGTAIATYAGQNYGAGNIKRIKQGVHASIFLSLCFAVLSSALMIFGGKTFTNLFLDQYNADVINSSQHYLNLLAIFFPFVNLLFIYRNVLQGIGRNLVPFLAGVIELILRSIVAFTLPSFLGFTGICLASPLAWIGACLPLCITYLIVMHKLSTKDFPKYY